MEKTKLIGVGNTAEVYDFDEKRVVKLFYEGYPKENIVKEFKNASIIKDSEFLKPKVHTLTFIDNRNGIIYDKLEGQSLLEELMKTGDINHCAKVLSQVHREILRQPGTGLDSFHQIIRNAITWNMEFSDSRKIKLLHILENLPEENILCHGDFHPGNILRCEDKIYTIDFMNLCYGNPLLDIARTVYLVEMTPIPDDIINKEEFLQLKKAITSIYLGYMGIERQELRNYIILILVRRLNEGINEKEKNMVLKYLESYVI
jgi:thiamine kinase-like enzyme